VTAVGAAKWRPARNCATDSNIYLEYLFSLHFQILFVILERTNTRNALGMQGSGGWDIAVRGLGLSVFKCHQARETS